METIFNLAPIICVLMTFLSLANVAAAIASDNRKYAKIFTAFVVGDCVYFVSFGKNVFGFNCLFPKVIDRMYYTEVCDMRKEKQYGKGSHQEF